MTNKYYQKHNERLQKESVKDIQMFLKEKKTKSEKRSKKDKKNLSEKQKQKHFEYLRNCYLAYIK